jgi:cyclophilin family peptidyl-prolyl cis-trans isomerase
MVDLETQFGTITLWLYDSTQIHRDNFAKLCGEGYYDSLLFHRVISGFMAQAGDPNSKTATAGKTLGNGGPDYTLPAEIQDGFFHKRGALAAAREGDDVNPEKRSSGSQFYIVQGRTFTPTDMDSYEIYVRQKQKDALLQKYLMQPEQKPLLDSIKYLKSMQKIGILQQLTADLAPVADSLYSLEKPFVLSAEQKTLYTTVGGAPHLDGGYTVFGEVTSGLSVLDSICAVAVDRFNRPLVDVRILKTRVYKVQ